MPNSDLPRRRFLKTAAAAAAVGYVPGSSRAWSQSASDASSWVLLGTGADGIYRARWNGETGELGEPELAVATPSPTYLTRNPRIPQIIYCCNEGSGAAAAVSAFQLNTAHASAQQHPVLTPLGSQQSHGDSPCFVSVDGTGRLLFAANYGGGSLAVFPLDGNQLRPSSALFACAGNPLCGELGPQKDRQDAPHMHCAVIAPGNQFVLACNLGEDSILVCPFNWLNPSKPLRDPMRIPTKPGAGPRHLAFDRRSGHRFYCISELDCTVVLYCWQHGKNQSTPEITPVPGGSVTLRPSRPNDSPVPNTGAEVALSKDGRFLYASLRGANLLFVFQVDAQSGLLRQIQEIHCGGKTPRFFALDPSERWLLCAHQDGNTIASFARNQETGELTARSTQHAASPQCILWLTL